MQKRLGAAELLAVAHRTSHDLPQHIAAPLVGGDHAIADEERHRAKVIRDDTHGDIGRIGEPAPVPATGMFADCVEQRREQVCIVVGELPLNDRGDPLEPHPGVDRGGGQRVEPAVALPIELHEDVVPDFDEPVAAAVDAPAGRPGAFLFARNVGATVEMDLRASAAGAGLTHLPEVLRQPELGDPGRRDQPRPDAVGLVITRDPRLTAEDRREQAIGGELPHAREQFPGERDGVPLEVVAEGEVPQHFEERVVAERGADVVEVVVLAAHPHALLRRRRT